MLSSPYRRKSLAAASYSRYIQRRGQFQIHIVRFSGPAIENNVSGYDAHFTLAAIDHIRSGSLLPALAVVHRLLAVPSNVYPSVYERLNDPVILQYIYCFPYLQQSLP